jgi:glycosyltransferase involved in cell wall biosynthesis
MAVGLPVVVCNDCGLASLVEQTRSGIVTDSTVPALAAAVESILADRASARAMGERGRETARTCVSMRAVGDRLLDTYTNLVDGRPGR